MAETIGFVPLSIAEISMSLPVPYLPDETRHDIRNTREGEYLFAPTPLMRQAFCFILATMARRYNVGIVAFSMMCTHIHLIIVDLRVADEPSNVPMFRTIFRSTFAQFVKWYWGRDNGRIFCPDSIGSTIKVVDFDSIENAIAYVETNPMAAGMEKFPERMKGAVSLRKWLLKPLRVERPDVYFQKRTWRDHEVLQLVVPPIARLWGHTVESFYKTSTAAVEKKRKRVLNQRRKAGLKTRPLHVLERLRPEHGTGKSAADHSEAAIACSDPYLAAMEFQRLRIFRRQHRLALRRIKEGKEDVVFPPGTYLAVARYGHKAAPSPRLWPATPQLE